MNIIIVDDNRGFRDMLKFFLMYELNHQVIYDVGSGEEFLELDTQIPLADLILMDLNLLDIDGFIATSIAQKIFPNIKVIAITMHSHQNLLMQLIKSGFRGFVNKSDIYSNIKEALDTVSDDKYYFPNEILNL